MSPGPTTSLTTARIKDRARALGFDACGVAPAADLPELGFLAEWLSRGYAGGMAYLARTADRRSDVRRVLPSARTVIVTATNYHTDRPYSTECADSGRAQIARYAWGDDYHAVIDARHDALLAWMRAEPGAAFDARGYVDTGPVQERVYARHAGIGWIGKNCCVIHEALGSWIFLGAIITSLDLQVDAPALDRCGTCTLCLDACPTQALVAPGVLDATRCISYLTIEHRGPLAPEAAESLGAHVYGCDVCQEVCPWNAVPPASRDPAWQPRGAWDQPALDDLDAMTDDAMRTALRGSPMQRTKIEGLRRNIAAARRNRDRG